jgi:multiple sugar transport system substrate-binding protein
MSDPSRSVAEGSAAVLNRRRLLLTGVAGAATAYGLTASGASARSLSPLRSSAGSVSFGSNASDPVPKKAYVAVFKQFTKKTGTKVSVNTVDHNTFQEQINSYLQGRPQDVFTWFAGYRMQFFAQKKLLSPIDDVWKTLAPQFPPALQAASKGLDGHYYFVPIYNYPWAVFYRKSVFAKHGYTVPKTLDELKTLGAQMKKDGLAPIGFADKDGWPAMGTFDILNMRINGFQFHQDLMAGKQAWDSKEVKDVFNTWRDLLPLHENNALGRTWQEAAQNLGAKKSGMYFLGSFVGQQFKGAAAADLDFFPFPTINPDHGTDSIDAPIDGLMMAKKPKNEAAAKAFLRYVGTGAAQDIYLKNDPNDVAAATDASTANYNALQKKAAEIIGSTKNIAQFLDRDTRPDFASPVVIPALQTFLKNPNDVDGVTKSLQQQAKSIFVD